MKYIFLILICFISLSGYSQYPAPIRSNGNSQPIDVRHKSGLNEILPVYNDTTQASLPYNIGNDSIGAVIYTRDVNALWYRTKQKYWSLIGTGSGGSGRDSLFAKQDSTATGTRYFNAKKNNFLYDSIGAYSITAYDTFNHYFTKIYLDTTYAYMQVSSNDFNTFGSISVTKGNATMSASSPDSGHQVVVNNGNVTVRDLRNNPSKLVITGLNDGTDTVHLPSRILVPDGDTVKSALYPTVSPTDTLPLHDQIVALQLQRIYVDTTQYLRYNETDTILYSIPVNGVFSDGLISIGGINLLDSTLTILPNIVAVRNNATITLTSSASFIINSTSTGYYRTDLIYLDSNNIVQHIVGIEDTVITVPPPVPYKGIGIAIVNVHNGVINSTIIPTANNWLVGGQSITSDSSIGTLTNNGMLTKIGGVNRSIYPATGGFALYGIGTTQMNAIPTPLAGTIIYNNDSLAYCYYNGAIWQKMGSGSGGGGGTITHAVDSLYTLSDSLLLVHYSPYNRTDTFSWRGSGGGSTYTAGTNVSISGTNVISSYDSTAYYATDTVTIAGCLNVISLRRNGINDTTVFCPTSPGLTNFSANNLSPLFTTSVATATTTPVLSFSLSNANGYTNFGNNGSTNGAPAFNTNRYIDSLRRNASNTAIEAEVNGEWRTQYIDSSSGTQKWSLNGNSNVTYGRVLGTTNNLNLNIVQNAVSRLIVDSLGKTRIIGTSAVESPVLGSELTTTGSGTNWSGSGFATGYTHTTGSTTSLTTSTAAVSGTTYYVAYTISGRTTGSITITYGGMTSGAGITATGFFSNKATATTTLAIAPTTDFNGTLILSIKVSTPSVPSLALVNSSGTIINEFRINGDTSNFYAGKNSGSLSVGSLSNTGAGTNTLKGNTTGSQNTATGYNALASNTTGTQNTATGVSSLQANTTGANNTANGYNTLAANTTGIRNVAVGQIAMQTNTTGSSNTAVGFQALRDNSIGGSNTAIGQSALAANTASNNTAIGSTTLAANTSGSSNVAVGASALAVNTTANNNSALGYFSLNFNTTGANNSAFGASASGLNINGSGNTHIGNAAGYSNTYEYSNTAVGYSALFRNGPSLASLTTTNAGSGYTDGSYAGIELVQSGLPTYPAVRPVATVVISGGSVSSVTITSNGSGLFAGQLLAFNTTPGGTVTTPWAGTATTVTPGGTNNIAIGDSAALSLKRGSNNVIIGAHVDAPGDTSATGTINVLNILYGLGGYTGTTQSSTATSSAAIGIGASPVASAALAVTSTTKGFLPPVMTSTQASAISSPAKGLILYVTDTNGTFTSAGLWIYTTTWKLIIAE